MPPCPWDNTFGTFFTGVFTPCCVTSHTGPTFSVMSMRPSGRNAIRHGRLNSATLVIVNGWSSSGGWVPAFTCARASADRSIRDTAAVTHAFMEAPSTGVLKTHACRHGVTRQHSKYEVRRPHLQ